MHPPIVIFGYNRPHHLAEVLKTIQFIPSKKIYIFLDGPIDVADSINTDLVKKTVTLFESTSPKEIVYRLENYGLTENVVNGLNHVFSIEESAIILEDDCVPSRDFFEFCHQMLDYYKEYNSVLQINGTNIISNNPLMKRQKESYIATRFALPAWGWATWSRAWKLYNVEYTTWSKRKQLLFNNFQQQNFFTWSSIINFNYRDKKLWDVQWMLDVLNNKGIVIMPTVNLVHNIGFGSDGTTTKNSKIILPPIEPLGLPIKHHDSLHIWVYESEYENELCKLILQLSD